jgi:hypothetical protein
MPQTISQTLASETLLQIGNSKALGLEKCLSESVSP